MILEIVLSRKVVFADSLVNGISAVRGTTDHSEA